MSGVYGSMGQPKASKPEVPSTTPGSSCFSLVFQELNKRFIKTQENKDYFLYCIVQSLTVIYNMYKSMTS